MNVETSFLELFDGDAFLDFDNEWFVFGEGGDWDDREYKNNNIDTYEKDSKVKDIIKFIRHPRNKDAYKGLFERMKKIFVLKAANFKIESTEIYEKFYEFVNLLCFNSNPSESWYNENSDSLLNDIEENLHYHALARYMKDSK